MSAFADQNHAPSRACVRLEYINRRIDGTDEYFTDYEHIVYVNSEIQNDTALGRLMHDFHCKKADDMYYEVLAERVRELVLIKNAMESFGITAEKALNFVTTFTVTSQNACQNTSQDATY